MLGELSNYNVQPRLFSYLISDGSECELVRKNWVVGALLTEQEFFKPFAHHPDFPTINQRGSVGGNYCQI